MFSGENSLKMYENQQIRVKQQKKISTSFQVHAAPESWSKNTTCKANRAETDISVLDFKCRTRHASVALGL